MCQILWHLNCPVNSWNLTFQGHVCPWPLTQGHASIFKLKTYLYAMSVPNFVKKYFCLGAKTLFWKLQYLKNPWLKLYWNMFWHWSWVRDNFWLSLNVCICCGFCNHLWQRFLHFWDIFPFLERVIKKLLLMQLKWMYIYRSYILIAFATF